jgi:hypothetical protein
MLAQEHCDDCVIIRAVVINAADNDPDVLSKLITN